MTSRDDSTILCGACGHGLEKHLGDVGWGACAVRNCACKKVEFPPQEPVREEVARAWFDRINAAPEGWSIVEGLTPDTYAGVLIHEPREDGVRPISIGPAFGSYADVRSWLKVNEPGWREAAWAEPPPPANEDRD